MISRIPSTASCLFCTDLFVRYTAKQLYCGRNCYLDFWHSSHPSKTKEYLKTYRQRHRLQIKKQEALSRLQPKRKLQKLKANRKWRENNQETHRSRNKAWKKANPELVTFWNKNRRLRKKGVIGSHSLQEWRQLKQKYNFSCVCCRREEPHISLTRDHIVPIFCGGSNFINNIQPLCGPCNSKKHTKCTNYVAGFV